MEATPAIKHGEEHEAHRNFEEKLAEACGKGPWMAILCVPTVEGINILRTTWKYPPGRFPETLKLINENVNREIDGGDDSPLPRADLGESPTLSILKMVQRGRAEDAAAREMAVVAEPQEADE